MNNQRTSEEIRRDIEHTRASMDRTVERIGGRLSPGELFEEALSMVKGEGRGAGDVVREHPVPLALMGLGLAWLAIERATDRGHPHVGPGTYERAEGRVGPYRGDAIGHDGESKIARAKERIADAAHAVADRAPDAGAAMEGARERVRDVKDSTRSFLENQPLAAAAVTFGIGLAAGLAAPATRFEDERIGRVADDVKREAKEVISDADGRAHEPFPETELQPPEFGREVF